MHDSAYRKAIVTNTIYVIDQFAWAFAQI